MRMIAITVVMENKILLSQSTNLKRVRLMHATSQNWHHLLLHWQIVCKIGQMVLLIIICIAYNVHSENVVHREKTIQSKRNNAWHKLIKQKNQIKVEIKLFFMTQQTYFLIKKKLHTFFWGCRSLKCRCVVHKF